jgi:hypothetical protein
VTPFRRVSGHAVRRCYAPEPVEASSPRGLPWLAVLGLAAGAGAGALLLLGQRVAAGAAVVVSAALFSAADVRGAGSRERFGTAVAARVADGAVLGGLSWVAVPEDPLLAGAALAALGAAYLAAYVRSKAMGLGFRLDRLFPRDGLHFLLVGLGLLLGDVLLRAALWIAVGASLVSLGRDAGRVAEQPEAR